MRTFALRPAPFIAGAYRCVRPRGGRPLACRNGVLRAVKGIVRLRCGATANIAVLLARMALSGRQQAPALRGAFAWANVPLPHGAGAGAARSAGVE
jgi:hypothetical protein